MMYNSPKLFDLSQKKLQEPRINLYRIQPQFMLGHVNYYSNGGRKYILLYVSGLQHEKALWQAWAVPLQLFIKWKQAVYAIANQTHRIRPAMFGVSNECTCICCKLPKHHWSYCSLLRAFIGGWVFQGLRGHGLWLCQPSCTKLFLQCFETQPPAATIPYHQSRLDL